MTLPRFNSGSVGALSFSHLNEAFDIIEGVSPQSPPSALSPTLVSATSTTPPPPMVDPPTPQPRLEG